MKNFRYVFFGTPEFAAIILKKLIQAGLPPEAVICNPDKPTGRTKNITPPPAKIVAQESGIRFLQPEKISGIENELEKINPDFGVVAAYSRILPKAILSVPRLGFIGVHPSLLPKYRGPSPIQFAILKGEEETGTTLFLLDEKMDEGNILAESKYKISSNESTGALNKQLAELSADLLVKIIPDFVSGKVIPRPQSESEATYTEKIQTADAFIEPEQIIEALSSGNLKDEVERKIRAFSPEPGAWTNFKHAILIGKNQLPGGKRIKLLKAETGTGKLRILEIQIAGRQPMKLI